MPFHKIISSTQFDEISHTYTRRTGLPLVLINSEGKIIHTQNRCTLCEELVENRQNDLEKNCCLKMLKAVEEAYRWGEGYITHCPLGLVMFAVPVVSEKKLIGGFLSGFAIFPKMKKDFEEEIAKSVGSFIESVDEMKLKQMKLKVFSPKRVRENVSLLSMLTRRFHLSDVHFLEDRKQKYIQHYKIANFLGDLKKNKPDISRKILDKQDEIIQKVKLGDKAGAREILNEFLGSIFFDSGMNFEIIKVRIIELIVIISRTAIEAGVGVKELMGLNYSYLTELNKAKATDELLFKLNEVLTNFINKVSAAKDKKKKIKIRKMLEYVNQNFTKKLTSEEVANIGDLSISRCLHLFKEETGLSLSQYIKKLRVDYGKYLLLNTGLGLADCAVEAGFYDQSHFTKTFSQIERMTPSRFRHKYKRLEWESYEKS